MFGSFTAFIYGMTVAGGMLADRLLGFRLAILFGAATMAAGYGLMAIGNRTLLFVGLAALIIGNGFLKPNVSSLLGQLYGLDDPRRDSGFTLFYMGINIGGMLALALAGVVANRFGYGAAFLLAGLGKCLAFATLYFGQRYLDGKGLAPAGRPLFRTSLAGTPNLVWFALGVVAAIIIAFFFLRHDIAAGGALVVFALAFLVVFLRDVARGDAAEQRLIFALLILFAFSVAFWAVYSQADASVLLFISRMVDRNVFGFTIPPSSFLSLNPLFIIGLAPLFSWLWLRLAHRHISPSAAGKFVIGLFLLGAAFLVLRLPDAVFGLDTPVAPGWLVAFFLLYSCGELCVSPVGLSTVTRWAPARLLGFAMGMWFLSNALADYVGGVIAGIAAVPAGTPPSATRSIYDGAFLDYGLIAIAAAAVLLIALPFVARLVRKKDSDSSQPGTAHVS